MNRRSLYVIGGLGLVVAVVLFWFLLVSPMREDIKNATAEIATQEQTLSVARAELAQMAQSWAEAERNQARLIELSKMVPQEDELPSLLLDIQDLATESGINFMSISPGTPSTLAGYQAVTLNLLFEGSFFDVNDFLYRSEQLAAGPGRLLSTRSISLTPVDLASRPTRLSVTLSMDAYLRAPAPSPAPVPVESTN